MINDLKEFEKFLKICRKQGVYEANAGGIFVKIGNRPEKSAEDDNEDVPTDGLTPDELMFYHLQNQAGDNQ